jgi:polyisoprenoid-binding protein YceI
MCASINSSSFFFFADKGQPCKACNNPDKFDINGPDSSVELAAGHLDPRTQFSGFTRELDFYDSEDEDRYVRYDISLARINVPCCLSTNCSCFPDS